MIIFGVKLDTFTGDRYTLGILMADDCWNSFDSSDFIVLHNVEYCMWFVHNVYMYDLYRGCINLLWKGKYHLCDKLSPPQVVTGDLLYKVQTFRPKSDMMLTNVPGSWKLCQHTQRKSAYHFVVNLTHSQRILNHQIWAPRKFQFFCCPAPQYPNDYLG